MELKYNGNFETLKDYGFELDDNEWLTYYDRDTAISIYVSPISKKVYLFHKYAGKLRIPTILYDLIIDEFICKEN